MQRRDFLTVCATASIATLVPRILRAETRREVSWLSEVQRPPEKIPATDRLLAPLLVDDQGQPITTLAHWQSARAKLREAWLKFLGPMPAERSPVKLEVLKEDRPEGCTRQLVRYLAE